MTPIKFRKIACAGKVDIIFRDSKGVLMTDYLGWGETVMHV